MGVRSGDDRGGCGRWLEHVMTAFIDDAATDKNDVGE